MTANILDSLSQFALYHKSWTYALTGIAIIIQGEVAVLLSTYLINAQKITWTGFIIVSLGALAIEEILLFYLGQTLKNTEIGNRLINKLPLREKIQTIINGNITKSLILAKFMWVSRIAVFWSGYSGVPFKKFAKASAIGITLWFTAVTSISYLLMSGLIKSEKGKSMKIELTLLFIIILVFIAEAVLKKALRKNINKHA